MEEFVFASNRQRWRFLCPLFTLMGTSIGVWFVAFCWMLLRSPALPDLGLGPSRAANGARAATLLARESQPRVVSARR